MIGIGLPLALGAATGSFGLPSVDDWSYRKVAAGFVTTGHVHFGGWVSMTLIGQVLWAWPWLRLLGVHGWVFDTSTAVLAAAGIVSAYWLARQLLSPSRSFAAVAVLIAAPGFALDTSTFMTDVPAFSVEMVSLALGVAALRRAGRARTALLVGSLAAGVAGFAIREFDIAAPLAVAGCAALAWRGRARVGAVVAGAASVVACAAVYLWSLGVPGLWKLSLGLPDSGSVRRLVDAYFLVAFCTSPLIVAAARRRLSIRRPAGPLAAVAVTVAAVVADAGHGLFVGNDLEPRGVAGTLLLQGGRPVLVGAWLWHLATVAAVGAGALLAWLLADSDRSFLRRLRHLDWSAPLTVFSVFTSAVTVGFALYVLSAPKVFDRYFWAVAFAAAVLLLRPSPGRPRRSGTAVLAAAVVAAAWLMIASVAVVLTVNSDAYAAGRWEAGELAVAHGVAPSRVDAGFEWVGWHSTGRVDLALQSLGGPAWEPWYALMQQGFRDCAVVSASPLVAPQLQPIGSVRYMQLGVADPARLFVYRVSTKGC